MPCKIKFTAIFTVLISTLLLTTSCTDFLHGRKKNENSSIIEAKNEKTEKCLKELKSNLDQFSDKDLSCIQEALDSFTSNTKGEDPNSYNETELMNYFNKLSGTSKKLDAVTLKAILKVKVFIVGGEANKLTRSEIESFKKFLDELKRQLPKIQDHYKLIFFQINTSEAVSFTQIQTAIHSFYEATIELLKLTQSKDSKLEFQDWKNIIFILSQFFEGESFESVIKWFPLIERAKILFLGDESRFFTRSDMKINLEWIYQSYGIILQYYYKVKSLDYQSVSDWESLISWMDQIFALVPQAPVIKDKAAISLIELDRSLEEVWNLKLFKSELSIDLYKSTYRKFINKFLEAGKVSSGETLKKEHIDVLLKEYHVWRVVQRSLNFIFSNIEPSLSPETNKLKLDSSANSNANLFLNLESFKSQLLTVKVDTLFAKLKPDANNAAYSAWLNRSYFDFLHLYNQNRSIVFNQNFQLVFKYDLSQTNISFLSANLTNALRSLMRLIMMGYGNNMDINNLSNNKISEANFQKFEEDFRVFGRALGLLDPRQNNSAARTFKEANLFAYSGNGDAWLSFQELYEGFSLLLSGGRFTVNRVYQDLLQTSKTQDLDIFGKFKIQRKAFEETLFNHIDEVDSDSETKTSNITANDKDELEQNKETSPLHEYYYNNIPEMKNFLKSLNKTERHSFFQNLMYISSVSSETNSSFNTNAISDVVEYAEMRTAITVLQYLESLILIYDIDKDGVLQFPEAMASAKRFNYFLKSLPDTAGLDDKEIANVFMYIIFKGKKPVGDQFWNNLLAKADFLMFSFKVNNVYNRFPNLLPGVSRKELIRTLMLLK